MNQSPIEKSMILVLAAGENEANLNDNGYPFYFTEFDGTPLIEHLVQQCAGIHAKFFFALHESEIKRWRLDHVIARLVPRGQLVPVRAKTAGAACTALLAIEHIESDEELLILNANEMIKANFSEILSSFRKRQLDAGTIVFHSVHPRYSYVALDENQLVTEAAEKVPISEYATAGFYWFARGGDFLTAAREMIAKEGHVDGHYYICPMMNEMILNRAKIGVHLIEKQHYLPFKTKRQTQNARAYYKG